MRFLLQVISAVMNEDEILDGSRLDEFCTELKQVVPIVVKNNPRRIYEVERTVDRMLKEKKPYELINKEIAKLRKYSFQSYI